MAQSEASAMMQVGACSLGCANRIAAARASLMVEKLQIKLYGLVSRGPTLSKWERVW